MRFDAESVTLFASELTPTWAEDVLEDVPRDILLGLRPQLSAYRVSWGGEREVYMQVRTPKVCVCLARALIAARNIPPQELPRNHYQWREQRSEESFLFFDRTIDVTDSSSYTEAFELLNSPSGI